MWQQSGFIKAIINSTAYPPEEKNPISNTKLTIIMLHKVDAIHINSVLLPSLIAVSFIYRLMAGKEKIQNTVQTIHTLLSASHYITYITKSSTHRLIAGVAKNSEESLINCINSLPVTSLYQT